MSVIHKHHDYVQICKIPRNVELVLTRSCVQMRAPGYRRPAADYWGLSLSLGTSRLNRRLVRYVKPSVVGPHRQDAVSACCDLRLFQAKYRLVT